MAEQEQVLVIETKVLEELGTFHGLQFDVERYLDVIFANGNPKFIPRPDAEKDPSFKQIIPYVIMSCRGKYLSYVRGKRAGETRLVGNRSIGIGGHINPIDNNVPLFAENFYDTYLAAVEREVCEEVSVETNHTNDIIALLNDDSNDVGKVHLGIVHYWNLDEPKVTRKEQMITQIAFMTQKKLQSVIDTMETWSALCLKGLAELDDSEIARLRNNKYARA